MGRQYAVEKHPNRIQIEEDLIKGVSIAEIARKYHIRRQSVSRYRDSKLAIRLKNAHDLADLRDADKLWDAIVSITDRARKLYDACDEYLTDPDDPSKYSLDIRASEIRVIYEVPGSNGRPKTRRANLQELIDLVEREIPINNIEIKGSDIKKVLLDTAKVLTNQLELLAKIQGQIKTIQINIMNNPQFLKFQNAILEATKEVPEVRKKIAHAIKIIR